MEEALKEIWIVRYYHLALICMLSFNSYCQTKNDSIHKKGLFLALNCRGIGEEDNIRKERFLYLVFVSEFGIRPTEKVVTGASLVVSHLFTNIVNIRKNYTPFETNCFIKYYPFRKPFRWLGLQAQVGVSNSCMDIYDPREELFLQYAMGPTLMFSLGGRRIWAINCVSQFFYQPGTICPGTFMIFDQKMSFWQYIGISYTFYKRRGLDV